MSDGKQPSSLGSATAPVSAVKSLGPTPLQAPSLTLMPPPAAPSATAIEHAPWNMDPVAIRSSDEAAVPSTVTAGLEDVPVAVWSGFDRQHRIGSAWEEFLVGFVDPLFRRSDGWHFYDPDAFDGARPFGRRRNGVALAGGLKFSLSF